MARKVCPKCGTDEALYSCERVTEMYPITFNGRDVDYTGGASILLDDGAEFEDDLYCRGCYSEYRLVDLVDSPNATDENE